MMPDRDPRPLIAHVVFRFDVGGLENGVVNLINHLPRDAYRHAVISLTDITDFRRRVTRNDVQFVALQKSPGHAYKLYPALYKLFRQMRPAIVHTRNLAALETVVPAWAAGVPVRLHGEHGRDMLDLHGANRKYQWVRRAYRPFVTQYIALSRDLERYLCVDVGVPAERVAQVYNGVDALRFRPATDGRGTIEGCPFVDPKLWLVGTVGRMDPVKDPLNLVRSFIQALQLAPSKRARMRLLLIGDGALYSEARAMLTRAASPICVASRRAQRCAGHPPRPRLLRAAFARRRNLQYDLEAMATACPSSRRMSAATRALEAGSPGAGAGRAIPTRCAADARLCRDRKRRGRGPQRRARIERDSASSDAGPLSGSMTALSARLAERSGQGSVTGNEACAE
jgi:glycosyltransferase involved in cell wall biosynthesis